MTMTRECFQDLGKYDTLRHALKTEARKESPFFERLWRIIFGILSCPGDFFSFSSLIKCRI